jgi:ribosomal RNA-processing protein 7
MGHSQMIKDYHVLPLSLPPLPSYPKSAAHYLYLRPHEPKIPTPSDNRTLFLVNVPIDSTTQHLKYLFTTQLSAGEVEGVKFEGTRSTSKSAVAPVKSSTSGRKRKRAGHGAEVEWPELWDRELRMPGSTALVLLKEVTGVDRVLKALKRLKGGSVEWGDELEEQEDQEEVPSLGSKRGFLFFLIIEAEAAER